MAWAQLTPERILNSDAEPQNWTTYSGSYKGWRYSLLDQVNRANVDKLKVAWVYQMPITERIETTPLVVDGIMYFSEPPSNVVALDAATGRPYWRYRRSLPDRINTCCGTGEPRCGRGGRSGDRRHRGRALGGASCERPVRCYGTSLSPTRRAATA